LPSDSRGKTTWAIPLDSCKNITICNLILQSKIVPNPIIWMTTTSNGTCTGMDDEKAYLLISWLISHCFIFPPQLTHGIESFFHCLSPLDNCMWKTFFRITKCLFLYNTLVYHLQLNKNRKEAIVV
jgi:hypothetical protein